jgi:hypothetical protein
MATGRFRGGCIPACREASSTYGRSCRRAW